MPRYVRRLRALLPMLAAVTVGACGGGDAPPPRPALTVFAASSLAPALEPCASAFAGADVRLAFAGSDELAAQIRQGVGPDVYAAADTTLPEALAAEELAEPPVRFATNELVLAVPAGGSPIQGLSDLAEPGVALAIGGPSVPVGAYARELLAGVAAGDEILANVRSEEPDVNGIVGKLAQGAVDAGFVYASDVAASGGALEARALPLALQPDVTYAAVVVRGSEHPSLARAFVDDLRGGACAEALRDVGLGPPPLE